MSLSRNIIDREYDKFTEDSNSSTAIKVIDTSNSHVLSQLKTTLYSPIGLAIETDSTTGSLCAVDYVHCETHDGSHFYFHEVIALGNGAVQDYIITTPDTTKWGHFGYSIDFNDGAGTFELYETTDRVGTTAQTIYNRNRNSANTNTITIHKNQSGGSTNGTRIAWKRTGSAKAVSGFAGTSFERILKQNTKYLLRVTNNTTSTNNISIELDWYEHTNK